MAKMFLYNKVYSDVSNIDELVNKNLTYNYNSVRISGIVKTDYKKYDNLDQFQLARGYFYMDLSQKYLSLFMTKDTYENTFFNSTVSRTYYKTDEDTGSINSTIYDIDNSFNEYLIGKLPENDNEIVVSLSTLINDLKFDIDEKNLSHDDLLRYLNKTISLIHSPYENFIDYSIVGIVNDYDFDVPNFNFMTSTTIFNRINNATKYIHMTAVLGNDDNENYNFLKYLNHNNYKHKTQYSQELNQIEYFTKELSSILNIMSGIFTVLTLFLIYTFISISIDNKQKEIGTLRAIGARGIDIAKIFVTESIIITLFAASFASLATTVITKMLNKNLIKDFKLDIVLLYVNINSILLIFIVSLLIMFISTFIPIKRITKMKPINAIKGLK